EDECFAQTRRLLSFIPSSCEQPPPYRTPTDDLDRADPGLATIIPDGAREAYDIKDVIRAVVDDGDFLEVQALYAMNIVVGFAREASGGACCVMCSKHIRADYNAAWPTAEIAVMGPEGAVNIVFKRELERATDKVAERASLVTDYTERFANPYIAAERGYIDDV